LETLEISGRGGRVLLELHTLLDLVQSVSPTLQRIRLRNIIITATSMCSPAPVLLPRLTSILLDGDAFDPIVPHLAMAAAPQLQVVELRASSSHRSSIEAFGNADVPWSGMTFAEMRWAHYGDFMALLSRRRTDVTIMHRESVQCRVDCFVCGLWLSKPELEKLELDSLRWLAGSQAPT
jgi:hypothetical protein